MSPQMDHTQASELLRPLLDGDLTAERAEEMRSHLASCDACSAELRALELLLELPDPSPSDSEMLLLHERVADELGSQTEIPTTSAQVKPFPFRYRLAQALGAAAVLAVVAGAGYFAISQSGQDATTSGGLAADAESEEQVAEIGFRLEFRRPGFEPLSQGELAPEEDAISEPDAMTADDSGRRVRGGSGGGAGADTGQFKSAAPGPLYVRGAGVLTDRTLTLVGRYGLPLVLYPETYSPGDAMDLQTDFLQWLANAAETPGRSEQIIRCGSSVLARPHPVLPALATFGRLENESTLVMAFAWTDAPGGRLDQFMVWTWRGGDCDSIPGYRAGFINQ